MAQCRCVSVRKSDKKISRCKNDAEQDAPFCYECEGRHKTDSQVIDDWDLMALDPVTEQLINA